MTAPHVTKISRAHDPFPATGVHRDQHDVPLPASGKLRTDRLGAEVQCGPALR